jgi:hypothetical protein
MALSKTISDPPQLCEIIKELLKEGAPYYEEQETLAHELGTDSPTISKIKYYKPEWEQHFRLFMKLVPIAIECGIFGAHHLLPEGDNESEGSMGSRKTPKAKAGCR